MEQRVVVLVLQVVKEMVKVDQIIPGAHGVDVSVATQRQVPTTQMKLLELKGAQAQYICKIVCVAGSEID